MTKPLTVVSLVAALALSVLPNFGFADPQQEQHTQVAMRMVGHQVLLSIGDSTSRVLPVKKEKNAYRIEFESDFGFNPDDVSLVIDSVITATEISDHYIVSFVKCETEEITHSYEVNRVDGEDVIACRTRDQPIGCYSLLITLLDAPVMAEHDSISSIEQEDSDRSLYLLTAAILIVALSVVYLVSKRSEDHSNPRLVDIGDYRFDKRRMELHYGDQKIELTSKECDLLQLLYDSANDTVERDTILRMVWNDEGDYVGRTLDVFISKLRKKLEADSRIKIANIRGVGYKLIIDA